MIGLDVGRDFGMDRQADDDDGLDEAADVRWAGPSWGS